MPPASTTQVSAAIANAAYTKAYLHGPDWKALFSTAVQEFLMHESTAIRSLPEIVIGLILLAVSALLGPNTTTVTDTGHRIKSNMNMFLAGMLKFRENTFVFFLPEFFREKTGK